MRNTRFSLCVVTASISALALAGCTSGATSPEEDGIVLTLTTWGDFFGYDPLLEEYEDANPGISIEHVKAANGSDARDQTNTYLAAGSGLSDVTAVESSWAVEMMQYPDEWVPVGEDLESRWLEWKAAPVTDGDGIMRMYGVDAGPQALCYRADLFDAAGIASDPDSVSAFVGETWEDYLRAGEEYTAATGKPWFDSMSRIVNAQAEQLQYAFQTEDGEIIADVNPEIERIFRDTLAGNGALSDALPVFSEEWNRSLGRDEFATLLCPSWMLGMIEGAAPEATGWSIANTFPGGGGYWGGSYLAVPTQSDHPEEASALAAWLTAPEQQLRAFQLSGAFPSQVDALDDPALLETTNEYFNGAPSGEIFATQAQAIAVVPYKGTWHNQIGTFLGTAAQRVDEGSQSIDESWQQFLSDVQTLK